MTSYFLSCSFFLQCNDFLEYFFRFQIKLVFLDSQEVNIKGCQGLNFFQISPKNRIFSFEPFPGNPNRLIIKFNNSHPAFLESPPSILSE